jgi:uroporphyrinogen-III synthase
MSNAERARRLAGTTATAQAAAMPRANRFLPALDGCYVISLRPVGGHATMRRAAAHYGARVRALSPWKIAARDDAGTRKALRAALASTLVVATSPSAVRAAQALQPLRQRRGQRWLAVGAGTAAALRRAGIVDVESPQRMDSEGLLALPALRAVRGLDIGLLTAPGGRDRIAPTLQRRGARVLRADVYARIPVAPSARAIATLRALDAPAWLALGSGEALLHVLATLPPDAVAILRGCALVVASERLAELARAHGFARIAIADDARPRSLLEAAARATAPRRERR